MKKLFALMVLLLFVCSPALASQKVTKQQIANKRIVEYYADYFKVDKDFCLAIAEIESHFKTGAYNNPKKGEEDELYISRGVMQLTIATGMQFNRKIQKTEDLYIAEQNIISGVKFIRYLFREYPNASIDEIAQMYNLGESKYRRGSRNADYVYKFRKAYRKDLDIQPKVQP